MATFTVTTEAYVNVPLPEEFEDPQAYAESIVGAALGSDDRIYLAKVTRDDVLLER